jgi:hypothetical protein
MRKLAITILALSTMGCQLYGQKAISKSIGSSSHAGIAYEQSCWIAQNCPDLTDEEIEDAVDSDGGAYRDSKWASENPDDIRLACDWPDEYPGSDEPGAGYRESQAVPECFDCD